METDLIEHLNKKIIGYFFIRLIIKFKQKNEKSSSKRKKLIINDIFNLKKKFFII